MRLTRDVESFKVGLNVSMSCDRLVESGGDWSADRFVPLGYFEMWVENEGRSIKGLVSFIGLLSMCSFHRLSGLTSLIWERVWDREEKVKVEGVDFLHPSLAS